MKVRKKRVLSTQIIFLIGLAFTSILGFPSNIKADDTKFFKTYSPLNQSLKFYSSTPSIYCPVLEKITKSKILVAADTKEFHVNICSSMDNPDRLYYVSRVNTEVGRSYILLPIAYKTSRYYAAKDGKYMYVLHLKRKQLRIYKRGQLLVEQKVYKLTTSDVELTTD